jgi:hypothetical protein
MTGLGRLRPSSIIAESGRTPSIVSLGVRPASPARFQSARRSPERHRPRCPSISPCSPVCDGQARVAPPAGSRCVCRSTLPWSAAWYGYRRSLNPSRSRPPNDARFWRTARDMVWLVPLSDCFEPSANLLELGRWVFRCTTMARGRIWLPWVMSRTRRLTRSQPRSLLSIAKLNSARSRTWCAFCRSIRIAQMSLGFKGGFWPIRLPLFQGSRR